MNRNVIVFGATGKTGTLICKELELNNITYSVFVRESSSDKIENKNIKTYKGDVFNEQEVKLAIESEEYTDVIIALGSKDLKASGIRSKGTQNIVKALSNSNPSATIHIISALGIRDSWNQLKWHGKLISNLLIKNTMNDHTEQEETVVKNKNPYHIIRPVALKDGESFGDVHVQNEGFLPSNSIQRADVAKYLVKSLLENKTGVSGICQVD